MGIKSKEKMAKLAVAIVGFALLSLACASNDGDIDYRVSFRTDAPEDPSAHWTKELAERCKEATSKGTFTIEIVGENGSTTGPQKLVEAPGFKKKDDGTLELQAPGHIQSTKIHAKNVGRIQKIKLASKSTDKWQPGWIKVNANDYHKNHRKGNGIYYGQTHEPVSLGESVQLGIKEYGGEMPGDKARAPANQEDHELELFKCEAAFCRKPEHRFQTEGDDVPPTHTHHDENGYHFGPLGEGMPGTHDDHSMVEGHFMREFLDLEGSSNPEEDVEEDYLGLNHMH